MFLTRRTQSFQHPDKSRWSWAVGAALALSLLFTGGVAASPAQAAPALGLTMTALGASVSSGDTTTYQIAWSCSSTSETCDAGTISVPVPTLQPDTSVSTVYVAGTASTGGFSGNPTVSGGVISWPMSATLPAGSSGQMTFTLRVPNMASPDGDTISPVATFTASGVTQTATGTNTVVSDTQLITDKRLVSNTTPGLDVPVAYQIATMHRSSINPSTGRHGNAPSNGTWAVDNVVTVDHLPVGAEFISATGGGVYDATSHTVTWPAWSENGAFVIAPDYQLVIRYPSTVFTTASTVTNTATASANPYLRPDITVTSADDATHGFAAALDRGAVGKGGSLARPNGGVRGSGSGWGISVSNSGTTPLVLDITDALPCLWSSPTDGTTTCATPAIKDVNLWLRGGQAGVIYTVAYTTNLGNTGTVPFVTGATSQRLPGQSASEWVTSIRITGTVPAGDNVSFDISGVIPADLPADSSAAVYRKPNVPQGAGPVYLENCLSGTLSTLTGAVVTNIQDVCGYVRVDRDRPAFRVVKSMTNNVQGVGGQMDVSFGLQTAGSNVQWHPVLTDLLPADLRYVDGSITTNLNAPGKAGLPNANLVVEALDNYNGTGRQLVRITWPNAQGLPGNGNYGSVSFKVQVQPGAVVGQRPNDVMAFDAEYTSYENAANPGTCYATVPTVDRNNLSGKGDTAAYGCLASATYTVVSSPAVGGTKWVKGSADDEFLAAPSIGVVLPGFDADYRLDVQNTGNVPLSNVVAYEILPYVGDTGVGPALSDERGSEWRALLDGAVTTDTPAEIAYSTSSNPCRGEVLAVGGARTDGPAGCVDDWTTTLPADSSDVRAIRIDFGATEFAVEQVHAVTIPVNVPADADGIAWNSFAVAADEASTGNAVLPVEPNKVGLRAESSLNVDKTASVATVTPGGEVVWTITVNNDGSGRTGGVIVVDRLPNYLEYVSSTSSNGTYDPETEEWVLSEDLASGESATLSIVTTVAADTPLGEMCNIADAFLDDTSGTPISSDDACIEVVPPLVPGFTLTKTSDPETGEKVRAGDAVTYTVTGTNTGETVLDPASIADDLSDVLDDATLQGAPTASTGSAPTFDGTTLNWEGVLAPGQNVVLSYTVIVNSVTDDNSTLRNVASGSGTPPTGPPIEPPPVVTEHPIPGFTLTKTADPVSGTTVRSGDVITYTVTGTNTGATVLDPASIDDDLSAVLNNTTLTSEPTATLGTVVLTDTTLNWSGALPVGESVTITYSVTVNADVEDGVVVRNSVSGSATPPTGPPIVPPPVVTQHPTPGFTLTKTNDRGTSPVAEGETITYTVTGTNTGETVLDPIVVTDDMSEVLNNTTLVGEVTSSMGDAPVLDGTTLTWTGALAAGESVVLTYTVRVDEGVPSQTLINNVVTASATPPGLPPIEPPPVETVNPVSGFTVTKTSNPVSGTKVNPGSTITYTVTATNTGATVLNPVTLTDDLTEVLNHTSIKGPVTASSGLPPTLTGNTLTWTGLLEVGASVKVTYSVVVDKNAAGTLVNNVVTGVAQPPTEVPPLTPPPAETEHPVVAVGPALAFTGLNDVAGFTLAGVLLLAGAAAMFVTGRRRRTIGN